MLGIAAYVIGGLLLLSAAGAWWLGGAATLFVPQLAIGGVLLIVALAIERWRYKPIRQARPEPGWVDIGERFVDPETGQLTAVYFDAATGGRHYLAAPGSGIRH
ncbi:MAG: hypothetical protein EPN38_06915 [Rhodanobacteraceae bacterium]|nr:MAG: hypothetical protein EPN38_06915 [Rhodanobacteraceae bacterium]